MYSKEGGAENGISSRVSIDVRMERDVEGRRGSREPPVSLRVSACNTCVCVCVYVYIQMYKASWCIWMRIITRMMSANHPKDRVRIVCVFSCGEEGHACLDMQCSPSAGGAALAGQAGSEGGWHPWTHGVKRGIIHATIIFWLWIEINGAIMNKWTRRGRESPVD